MLIGAAGLTNTGLPAILVANKCENPEDEWEVDVQAMAEHKYFEACIATYRASVDNPEVSRACVHAIIRAAVAQRKGTCVAYYPLLLTHMLLGTRLLTCCHPQKIMAIPHQDGEPSPLLISSLLTLASRAQ